MEIKDSGNRREFETGAVRDMALGKGREDLAPLEVVAELLDRLVDVEGRNFVGHIASFQKTEVVSYLYDAIECFLEQHPSWDSNRYTMLLEVGKHFEEGARKYGENNWQKGLPVNCYIDSALRHYYKFRRGDYDEPHDKAIVWNLLCCIWTVNNFGNNDDSVFRIFKK